MQLDDTIAAVATALGRAGLAVVRISGPEAAVVLGKCFRRPRGAALRPGRAHFGHVVDPATGDPIDEAMAWFRPRPNTYTREPFAEISCHGGEVAPRVVLGAVLAAGARAAEPGEFTLRAFLNGRIDLAQAEAVLDVVEARTAAQLRLARSAMSGALSARVGELRRQAIQLLAQLAATIDFPDDAVPEATVADAVRHLVDDAEELLRGADHGELIRTGARVAIAGPPNAGKSTLMNALLGRERAIVAPTPGTTRDTLEETLSVDGIPLVLIDTAGLRSADDPVERIGVERSAAAVAQADALLLVLDGSRPADRELHAAIEGLHPTVVALNKSDLGTRLDAAELGLVAPAVMISALEKANLGRLLSTLRERLAPGGMATEAILANSRHVALVREAQGYLAELLHAPYADQMAAGLEAAVDALGRITGETTTDDLLAAIFSRFCIGK